MGKRFDTLVFPGHKTKAFTLSYDDGVIQDRKLVELFDRYGAKATFNLNSQVLGYQSVIKGPDRITVDISKVTKEEAKTLYAGHEIGGHGLYHSSLTSIKSPLAMYEIIEDKAQLEELTEKPLTTFAYPFGHVNEKAKQLLRDAGYTCARTVVSTGSFAIPEDFLELNPTCHHNDPKLMELADRFIGMPDFMPALFYVWGHGYEFDHDNNYEVMEELLAKLAAQMEKIWFATNGEITAYVEAYRALRYSANGTYIHNPSALDVEILTAFNTFETIKAGETITVKETAL